MKTWYLYLLECSDGSIYTGISVDVAKRFAAHAAGRGARYTRSHRPKRILASIEYPDRSSASTAEYAMKQLTPGEKRAAARSATRRSAKGAKLRLPAFSGKSVIMAGGARRNKTNSPR
ncbi:MAG: GIY-YIG nuclease family protein [Betaproteobacteria bacterium]|nr:GIY-YIG nuclease family protein [Betaproteobacteria bacterium]